MSQFPYHELFKPSLVCSSAKMPQWSGVDTPYGLSCWQVLDKAKVTALIRAITIKRGVDASAMLAIEPVLRWRTNEKEKSESVVLSHNDLINIDQIDTAFIDPKSRALIGDGLLCVAACQIVMVNEAWQTYQQLFAAQPIGAAIGTIVAIDRPPTALPRNLNEREQQRLGQLVKKYGNAGRGLFESCNSRYPVTLDMVAASDSMCIEPTAAPASTMSIDNNELEDDTPLDQMGKDYAPSSPPPKPKEEPVQRPNEQLLIFQRAVLESSKFRVQLILRGYLSRAAVRGARRLTHRDDQFYWLDGKASISSSPFRVSSQMAVDHPDDDGDIPDPEVAATPAEPSEPIEPVSSVSVPIWERHLLDRLDALDLSLLTYYEVNLAVRDRFNFHSALYAFWKVKIDDAPDHSNVYRYPRGYRAPVLQPLNSGPGLLSVANHLDYAAIGLAGLCIVAKMNASFRQWLLDAEAYYFRVSKRNADPTRYLMRIDAQIEAARVPMGSELAHLLGDILKDALHSIKHIDEQVVVADDDDDDGEVRTPTADQDDISEAYDELSGDGDKIE